MCIFNNFSCFLETKIVVNLDDPCLFYKLSREVSIAVFFLFCWRNSLITHLGIYFYKIARWVSSCGKG